jgi:hypothetical protein
VVCGCVVQREEGVLWVISDYDVSWTNTSLLADGSMALSKKG